MPKRLIITPGEPAGIGPDVTLALANQDWPVELVVIADPNLLAERAQQLGVSVRFIEWDGKSPPQAQAEGSLTILPVKLAAPVIPGELNVANASYVMETLTLAISLCQQQVAQALVTGPVHKEILNKAGIPFSGHTELLADVCQVAKTVMLFVVDELRVALATTHLPLSEVPAAITGERLTQVITILQQGLQSQFLLSHPRLSVCGLNPHAGEGGYLGREEIDVITPTLQTLRAQGFSLEGPLPADTAFTPAHLAKADAILAMYHDQVLPLIKHLGFDRAVNVTLGLSFVRTSVDHGTALTLAGTGLANPGSLLAAVNLAHTLAKNLFL